MKKFRMTETITNRESDAFKKYLLEVANIPVLSTDEEYEIAMLAHQNPKDTTNVDKLVKHNLRFVISVAKQYATPSLKLEDLVNEGNYGLITGAKRFDPTRGFKFISYGVHWIRRSILGYIAEHGRTIRLPNNKNNVMQKIKTEYDVLEQILERVPSYGELTDALDGNFTDSEISFFIDTISTTMISLDTVVGHDGSSTPYSDLVKDNNTIESDHLVNKDDSKYNISKILGVLKSDNEREVLTMLFGLNGEESMKLKTVGLVMGLTSERVRQIRDAGLIKLRHALK
jgi:RNA polymerase primary sigma factor